MRKLSKLLLSGSIITFIAVIFYCCSACAGESANVSYKENTAAKVDTASYADYEGKYQLAPNFIIAVTKKGDSLYTQATGQSKVEIYPESEDNFYLKVVPAKIKFNRNSEGKVESLTLFQNGQEIPAKKQIAGMLFQPPNRPQNPKKPYPYHEEEVTYNSNEPGITLAGTLTLPESEGPFPAVVLISGSGAQNRNEELMGHKPFLVLADYLTRQGIAVLRFDDRGVGGSSKETSKETSENFAQDVLGGVSYLKSRKEINHSKIGLIGHSEGGLIAPIAAAGSSDIAFIVMMAGPGVNGEEILKLQGKLIMEANGIPEEKIEENARIQKVMIDIIKSTTDKETAKEKIKEALAEQNPTEINMAQARISSAMTPWMRYFITFDPKSALEKVKCPVLAVNGEKDLQVPPDQNLPEIEKALAAGKNKDFKTIELPGLNHLFQTCKTGSVAEYGQIEETISPTVLELISSWILEHVS